MTSSTSEPDGARVRLDVAYDGTDFHGWARQPGLRTVQGVLEAGLETLFRRQPPAPTLTVAGRTDAGVHATGQVTHLDLTAAQLALLRRRRAHEPALEAGEVLARRLNGILGPSTDVIVRSGRTAPPGFDARFSGIWRRYRYRIADHRGARDPLRRRDTTWHARRLDVDAMDAAAPLLLGLHDFAAFCKQREGATTIRTLQRLEFRRDEAGVIVAEVRADAFCHSMVRALLGAYVALGEGRLTADDLVRLRDERRRVSSFAVLPARGLDLVDVGYPPDDELAARAEQTRARRGEPGEAGSERGEGSEGEASIALRSPE